METRLSERELPAVVAVGLQRVVLRYSFRILLNAVDVLSRHVPVDGVLLGPTTSNRIIARYVCNIGCVLQVYC